MRLKWTWPHERHKKYPIYQNHILTGSGNSKWGLLSIRIWYPRIPKLKNILFINWDHIWIDLE